MSFSEKKISLQLSLASGEFEGGGNSAMIEGLRTSCQIRVTGAPSFASMEAAIYGLPLSTIQQLTTVGAQWNARYKNGVDVLAGDDNGMSLVFSGTVFNAFFDGAQMPETCLRIVAAPLVFESVVPAPPTSVKGGADAAGMIKVLASQIGVPVEDNGVNVKLSNPYYSGSPWSQIQDIARDGNFDLTVDRGTIVISPHGVPRQGKIPLMSPTTGMTGYPMFVQNRIVVRGEFNPQIQVFGALAVQSELQPANGNWQVVQLDHDLESVAPGGNWFSTATCNPFGTS